MYTLDSIEYTLEYIGRLYAQLREYLKIILQSYTLHSCEIERIKTLLQSCKQYD